MTAKQKTLISVAMTGVAIGSSPVLGRPAPADKGSPVGTWKLVSFISEDVQTKKRTTPFGEHPNGIAILTPEGRLLALLTAEGRRAPQTAEDRDAAFRSEVAYSGRYHVDGNKFVTKVDVAWNESWVGTEQIRFFKVEGDRLYAETAPLPNVNSDGRMVHGILVWEREK